jgi:outer membrane receptor for ferrienterochelin and colicins
MRNIFLHQLHRISFKKIIAILASTQIAVVFGQATGEEQSSPDTQQLQTVVVSARRSIEQRFFASGSLVVVDRNDIERLGADSVGDVIRQLPGVQVTPSATGGVEIRMRGMDSSATQILIDGQRVSSGKSQLPIDQLPAELIERIEVVRAPSAQFSGASGGTLNIVLRQASAKRETNIRLTDNYVWNHHAGQMFISKTGPLGNYSAAQNIDVKRVVEETINRAATVEASSTDIPSTNNKDFENTPSSTTSNKQATEISPQSWNYFVAISNVGQLWGDNTKRETTISDDSATSATGASSRYRRSEFTLVPRLNGKLSSSDQLTLRGTFSRSHLNGGSESEVTELNANNVFSSMTREHLDRNREYLQAGADWIHRFKTSMLETTINGSKATEIVDRVGDIELNSNAQTKLNSYNFFDDRKEKNWSLSTKLTGTSSPLLWSVGAETDFRNLQVDNLSSTAMTSSVNSHLNAKIARHTLWAQNEWELPARTTLTAGLRAEKTIIQSMNAGASAHHDQFFLQPSLHARTPILEDFQLRTNLARISKNPNIWDLIDRTIPTAGTNSINSPDYSGNPNLRPEKAWALDFGFERRLSTQGQVGLNVFVRSLTDAMGISTSLIDERWTVQRKNVGNANVWGVEADVKTGLAWLGLGSDWSLAANASLLQSTLTSGENQGSRIPGQAHYIMNVNIAKPLRRTGGWYGGTSLSITGPAQQNTSPNIFGSDHARALLDIYFGSVIPNLGYWRFGVYNVGNAKFNRDRNYQNSNGVLLTENSTMKLTPRIYLAVGTQF